MNSEHVHTSIRGMSAFNIALLSPRLFNQIRFDPRNPADADYDPSLKDKDDDSDLIDPKKETFTRAEANSIAKSARERADKKQLEKTKKLLEEKNLSDAEKKRLESDKASLEDRLLTEKEREETKYKNLSQAFDEYKKKSEGETTFWKTRAARNEISQEIAKAARTHGWDNFLALEKILKNDCDLRPVLNDKNEHTGDYSVGIEVERVIEGRKIKQFISVSEVVEGMSKEAEWKSFFNSTRASGSGTVPGSNKGSSGGKKTSIQLVSEGLSDLK